jgi:MFS family permease
MIMEGSGGGFVADLRIVLRGRDFRRLFAVRLTGQFGDGVLQVGLASYVFFSPERQATASAAAAAFAVLLLPYSLVGPFAGVLLDRWMRRQVLLWANVVRTALVLVVAALVIGGHAGPAFYGVALATLSVNRFILAGLSASLPHVVPRHELVMANAVSPTSGTVTAVLGGLAGFLLSRALGGSANEGTDVAVLTTAAGVYLVAGLLALRMRRDLLGPDLRGELPDPWRAVLHVAAGMVAGARHVAHRPPAARALGAIAAHRFFYGISTVAVILLQRNYFHDVSDIDGGLTGLATVFVATALGLGVAAVVTPVVTRRIAKERWVVTLLVVAAGLQVFPAALYTEPAVLVAAAGLGVASQGIKIVVDTVVQESIDDEYRGRVFSIYDMLFNVGFVAAAAFAAATLPPSGRSYTVLGVISTGYLLTALWYGRGLRRTPAAPPTTGAAPPAPPPRSAARGPAAPPAGGGTPDPPAVREAPPARP